MKKSFLLAIVFLFTFVCAFSQPTDPDIFTLNLGGKKCLFKYSERADTLHTLVESSDIKAHSFRKEWHINPVTLEEESRFVKDSAIVVRSLSILDDQTKSVHIRKGWSSDTFATMNPVTLVESLIIVPRTDIDYILNLSMSYAAFLELVKGKIEIKNNRKSHPISSMRLYYQSIQSCDLISPESFEKIASETKTLAGGGFVLLSLESADNGKVVINTQGRFLVLINITEHL